MNNLFLKNFKKIDLKLFSLYILNSPNGRHQTNRNIL